MPTQQRTTVYEAFLRLLEDAIREAGSAYRLADSLGVAPNVITRWRNHDRVPMLDSIQPLVDYMGRGFTTEPTQEEIEARIRDARDAKKIVEALSRDNERMKMQIANLRGEIAALERQLDRQLSRLSGERERGRAAERSSTGSRTNEENEADRMA